jgi:hypothetical protein
MLSAIELNAFPKSAINPTRSYVVSFTRVIPLSPSDSIAHVVCPTKSLNTFPSSSYTTRRGVVRVVSAFVVVVVVVVPSLSPIIAIARVTRARIGVTAPFALPRASHRAPSVASSPRANPRRRRFAFATRDAVARVDARVDADDDADVDADVDAAPSRRPIARRAGVATPHRARTRRPTDDVDGARRRTRARGEQNRRNARCRDARPTRAPHTRTHRSRRSSRPRESVVDRRRRASTTRRRANERRTPNARTNERRTNEWRRFNETARREMTRGRRCE